MSIIGLQKTVEYLFLTAKIKLFTYYNSEQNYFKKIHVRVKVEIFLFKKNSEKPSNSYILPLQDTLVISIKNFLRSNDITVGQN